MPEATHTPKPWTMKHGGFAKPFDVIVIDERGDCIAIVDSRGGLASTDEMKRNGILIAAAPDLLDALRELHDFAAVDLHYRHNERSKAAFKNAAKLLNELGG